MGKVVIGTRGFCIDDTVQAFCPTMDTRFHWIPVIGIFYVRPTTGGGIDTAKVFRFPIVDQAGQVFTLIGATRLVAVSHHAERRMVAIFFQDTVAFITEPLIGIIAITHCRPAGTFDLQVNTHAVGYFKSCAGRAPGMETDMVQSMCLALAIYFCPVSVVHCRIAGQREDTAFQCSPEENGMPVYFEACSVRLKFTKTECTALLLFIAIGFGGDMQCVQVRGMFRP